VCRTTVQYWAGEKTEESSYELYRVIWRFYIYIDEKHSDSTAKFTSLSKTIFIWTLPNTKNFLKVSRIYRTMVILSKIRILLPVV
jgi:hypothetical protein